jgi:methylmalonyl-CoA mutase N-terminal domain/subunit
MNKFQVKEEEPASLFRVDDSIREQQVQRLRSIHNARDQQKANASLDTIREKAINNENLMPAVIEAVENMCTLGEIAGELRKVFGEYK